MHTRAFILGGLLIAAVAQSARATEVPQCLAEPVVLRRFGLPGPLVVSLTDCEGRPNPGALAPLATVAQPQAKPEGAVVQPQAEPDGTVAARGAELEGRLNPQLLVRLQRLATQFPERAIEIVSGYRARGRSSSRHRSGDALDVRVEGVDNAELSTFARTLEGTGVGYYPNSTFVHIDVRPSAAYWVDRSGPGEAPDYMRRPRDPAPGTSESDAARAGADAERVIAEQVADVLETLELHGPELPVADQQEAEPNPTPSATLEPVEKAEPSPAGAQAEPAPAAEPDALAEFAAGLDAGEAADTAEPPSAAPVESEAPQDRPEPESVEPDADAAALESELRGLAERALIVMRANEVL